MLSYIRIAQGRFLEEKKRFKKDVERKPEISYCFALIKYRISSGERNKYW